MPRLIEANAEQILQTWRLNHQEWGTGLTVEQYIAREQAQVATYTESTDASPLPRQIHWILVPDAHDRDLAADDTAENTVAHDTGKSGVILAACESLYRPALQGLHGTVTHVAAYSIASVFVSPDLRGRGYGKQLMTLVARELEGRCAGSALFSDIGPHFYALAGWQFHTSSQVTFHLSDLSSNTDVSKQEQEKDEEEEAGHRCEWVTRESLNETCLAECKHVQHEVQLQSQNSDALIWSFLPTLDVLQWHYARTHFMTRHLNVPDLRTFGCQVAGGVILWNYQPDKHELLILRKRYSDTKVLKTLLASTVIFAKSIGAEKVVSWDADETLYKDVLLDLGLTGIFEHQRSGSLNALQVYSKHNKVEWINKEKFSWC